jgi:hypothetical protein
MPNGQDATVASRDGSGVFRGWAEEATRNSSPIRELVTRRTGVGFADERRRLKAGKYDHELGSARDALSAFSMLGSGTAPLHRFRVVIEFMLAGQREVDGMVREHARSLACWGNSSTCREARWLRSAARTSSGTAAAGPASWKETAFRCPQGSHSWRSSAR